MRSLVRVWLLPRRGIWLEGDGLALRAEVATENLPATFKAASLSVRDAIDTVTHVPGHPHGRARTYVG